MGYTRMEKKGNKHRKFDPSPYARKHIQQARQVLANPLRDPAIPSQKHPSTPNLVKTNNKNDFQT